MNGNVTLGSSAKPLPPPARDEKLPPPPPPDLDAFRDAPPAPPVKIDRAPSSNMIRDGDQSFRNPAADPSLHTSASGLDPPPTPGRSPSAPSSPSADGKTKKSNPLTDLIETERSYVDLLAGIIRKVAGAWSRSNLPPPELDTMFRGIESIYKANRSMLSKLKDIGASSSPKALGDLLMRWIDDLEAPYTTYCNKFCTGFDTWEPVQSNTRLRTTLAMFSSSNPPPLPPSSPVHPSEPLIWSLDELFLLPKGRLEYYRKLYSRLLKSTAPGRSDHKLLSGALAKLDRLIVTVVERANVEVGAPRTTQITEQALPEETEDEVVIDMRSRQSTFPAQGPLGNVAVPPQRASDGTHSSRSMSSGDRRSEDTSATSDGRMSSSTMTMPISDLERRLATERTLDIFTMRPKQVRLQISPPTLPFTRELRFSADAVIRFVPQSTGVEVVHELGHIFVLTDLILICERMTPQQRARGGHDGPDMWLSYPPLAGKHLRVAPAGDSSTALALTIMRKETLILHVGSPGLRAKLLADFKECIDAAASLVSSAKSTPPPLPTLPSVINTMAVSPQPHEQNQQPCVLTSERHSGSVSPPRGLTPGSAQPYQTHDSHPVQSTRSSSASDAPLADSMARLALASETAVEQIRPDQPNPTYPMRSSSRSAEVGPPRGQGQLVRGPSFGPGQVVPPQFSHAGQGAPSTMPEPRQGMPSQPSHYRQPPPSFGPGQVFQQGGEGNMRSAPPLSMGPELAIPNRLDGGMRSAPPDAGYMSFAGGPGRPPLERTSSGGVPIRPNIQPGPGMGPGHPGSFSHAPGRPPSDPPTGNGLRQSTSSRSLRSQYDTMSTASAPPMPAYPGDLPPPRRNFIPRTGSSSSLRSLPSQLQTKPLLPSAQMSLHSASTSFQDPSPPESPVEERPPPVGPTTTNVTAQMKCKVFLQQQHAQWKSLGTAKLKLYHESPTNVKQLVVEADNKDKTVLISTIVMEDGVERVGKTGVAVALSDKGRRTGIIYMIQLRNEKSAGGLFDSLIVGSDRSALGSRG